jgi:signal transduction histidine kinase
LSRISAVVQAHENQIELRVSDQGDGIPKEALPHVFDRFYRADRSRSRNSGGAGLGLSICKAIVERAGGSIDIQSASGAGTQIIVSLPVALPIQPQSIETAPGSLAG